MPSRASCDHRKGSVGDRSRDRLDPGVRFLGAADEDAEDALAVCVGEPDLDHGVAEGPLALWLLPASTPTTEASAMTNSVFGTQRTKRSSDDVSVSRPLPRITFHSRRIPPSGSTVSKPWKFAPRLSRITSDTQAA